MSSIRGSENKLIHPPGCTLRRVGTIDDILRLDLLSTACLHCRQESRHCEGSGWNFLLLGFQDIYPRLAATVHANGLYVLYGFLSSVRFLLGVLDDGAGHRQD